MNGAAEIGWPQLGLCTMFVLVAGLATLVLRLGLHRDLLWGTVRTFSQLFLLGLVLKYVFDLKAPFLVLAIFWLMVLFAVITIRGRVKEKSVRYFDSTFLSMLLSYTAITMLITAVIVQVEPWYEPRYFIPLGGMVIGNSMNAIAITLDRLFRDLKTGRNIVEMKLSVGGTYREATADTVKTAIRAGMIPSINSMMSVGIVFIPGMMTGQVLAGSDVFLAVKYQIMVMLMLVGSTSLGSVLVVFLVLRRCFTREGMLRL
ncbi:MAG: iron export ABC transporter permease subunit FetB [bacterium]